MVQASEVRIGIALVGLGLALACSTPAGTPPAAAEKPSAVSTGARDYEKIAREMYADDPGYAKAWPIEFHIRIVEGVTGDIAAAIRNLGGPIGADQFAGKSELALGEPGEFADSIAGIRKADWKEVPLVPMDPAAVRAAWMKWLSAYRLIDRVTVKPKANPRIPAEGKFEITAGLEVAGQETGGGWRRDNGKAEMAFERGPNGWRVTRFVTHGMTTERRATKMFDDATAGWIGTLPDEVKARLTGKTASEEIYDTITAEGATIPADVSVEPVAMDAHPGIAIADLDGDGFDDVLVWDVRGRATLLRNVEGTHFEDASHAFGLEISDVSSAIFADLDGDGVTDLVVGRWFGPSEILKGVRAGAKVSFLPASVNRAMALPSQVSSIAVADVNADGRLDIFFGTAAHDFHARMVEMGKAPKDSDTFVDQVGPPNVLLVNDGQGRWHDGTKAAGLDLLRNTLSPAFADVDGDGYPELYVGNDFARANFYKSEKGHFRDISKESGADKIIYGMGASWGDIDGDGKLDLYASAMQSSAGARIMADDANFRPGFRDDEKAARKLAARGNTLLHWDGKQWSDLTETKEFGAARNGNWAFGGIFVDIDGDGWQDLVSLNGFFTAPGVPPEGIVRDL